LLEMALYDSWRFLIPCINAFLRHLLSTLRANNRETLPLEKLVRPLQNPSNLIPT